MLETIPAPSIADVATVYRDLEANGWTVTVERLGRGERTVSGAAKAVRVAVFRYRPGAVGPLALRESRRASGRTEAEALARLQARLPA